MMLIWLPLHVVLYSMCIPHSALVTSAKEILRESL